MTDLTVPKTILAQLGVENFVMTSDATGLIGSADSLTFKLGRNPKRVTHVRVTRTRDGLYDMTFFTTGKGPQSHDGIHPEMLREVFDVNTGLFRTSGHPAKNHPEATEVATTILTPTPPIGWN